MSSVQSVTHVLGLYPPGHSNPRLLRATARHYAPSARCAAAAHALAVSNCLESQAC